LLYPMSDQLDMFAGDGCADGRSPQDGSGRPEASEHGASGRWPWPATREHGSAVELRTADSAELADLENRAIARRGPDSVRRSLVDQSLLDSWVSLLGPHFDGCDAASVTMTYATDYGYSHGLMLPRNVRSDFLRAVSQQRPNVFTPWGQGIEQHNTGRLILHSHAILGGDWSELDMARFKAMWEATRGWCRIEPVTAAGGCVAYCAKHLLKRGAADNFDFQVTRPARAGSRQRRREDAR